MMRRLFFLVATLPAFFCSGANVLWNQVGVDSIQDQYDNHYWIGFGSSGWVGNAHVGARLTMGAGIPGRPVKSVSVGIDLVIEGSMGTWALVSEGDILDAAFFESMADPLARKTTAQYTQNMTGVTFTDSFYLGVQAETVNTDGLDDWYGDYTDSRIYTGEYVYGWIELSSDSDGKAFVVSSAFDADGGPMIVGGGLAVPEPTSGLLLLVGGSLLALRSRR